MASFERAATVTPHDTNTIGPYRALWVGGAGNVALVTVGGQSVTLAVPAGTMLAVAASVVKATGTTATNIVGFW